MAEGAGSRRRGERGAATRRRATTSAAHRGTAGSAAQGRLVYRESIRWVARGELAGALARAVERWQQLHDAASAMVLVLQASAVECALADAGENATPAAARLLDGAAAVLVGLPPQGNELQQGLAPVMMALAQGGPLRSSTPEGFAFYALDPVSFASAAVEAAGGEADVLVVGIRTAGTTLAAVAAAALRRAGCRVERLGVRPAGHPFDRSCSLEAAMARTVAEAAARDALCLVVDEGPGLSGSSFLATAEALVAAGARADRVVLLGSRTESGEGLCAPDGARRWRKFRSHAAGPARGPAAGGARPLWAGQWRALWLPEGVRWPAVWPQVERAKFVVGAQDRAPDRWFKFEGFGAYGEQAVRRQERLAGAGLAVAPADFDAATGFVSFPVISGVALAARALDQRVLGHLAEYVAFRSRALLEPGGDAVGLETMARVNAEAELGAELPEDFALEMTASVLADARLQPHEWLRTTHGELLKTDAVDHGDDHFYPGPTDPAWDLAGAMIEWRMSASARAELLARYRAASGDDAAKRMPAWLVAYAAAHAARSRVAAAGTEDLVERRRLLDDVRHYRAALRRAVDGVRGVYRYCTYLGGDHIRALRSSGGRSA